MMQEVRRWVPNHTARRAGVNRTTLGAWRGALGSAVTTLRLQFLEVRPQNGAFYIIVSLAPRGVRECVDEVVRLTS